ncbi:MAG: zf-HC2 domain-containing protein, partial [Acidobacteria bacterium]|nr:zf-HC2 domain-containing protein [Acidobacteriota bacterium]
AYVDRELPPVHLRLVEEHLAECDECRQRADGMRSLVSDLRRLERLAPPPTLGATLHRRIVLRPRPRGLVERLESRLGGLSLQPSVGFTFALVLAFAAILYFFADSLERHERRRIPVLRPDPPATSEETVREAAGRTFELREDTWYERGLKDGGELTELGSDDPAYAEVVSAFPDLRGLLAEGTAVELLHDGKPLRLTPSGPTR